MLGRYRLESLAGQWVTRHLARWLFSGALLLAAGVHACLYAQEVAAEQPAMSLEQIETYFAENERALERRLQAYNRDNKIITNSDARWRVDIQAWQALETAADRVFVKVEYAVGDKGWVIAPGQMVFELVLADGELSFVGHQREWVDPGPTQEPALASEEVAPLRSLAEVEAYFEANERQIARRLAAYNRKHRYAVADNPDWGVRRFSWTIERLATEQVYAEIQFVLKDSQGTHAVALFELQWQEGELSFVGHEKPTGRAASNGGWLSDGSDGCVYNYYAARPCIDTVRQWKDFVAFNGLPLDPESALIFQAYKHNRAAEGDRRMARARGLPEPSGESVFDLQAEFNRMDLGRYQRNAEAGCDLNPYGPKPCPEMLRFFLAFAAKYGLPLDANTGAMFEAYAHGNFRKADVIYAMAKDLAIPVYGYIPTGPAMEVAGLRMRLQQIDEGKKVPCSPNPYMPEGDKYKPCADVLKLWCDFAARYQLADNAEMAHIFARYAVGEYRSGDQFLAQAMGVSLEQLLDAAGVPRDGLVIEVYPGKRRPGQRSSTGG